MARGGCSTPTIDSLLAHLPGENDNNYTFELKKIVLDNDLLTREENLEDYLKDIHSNHRFAAFYALLIICREYNNHSKYNSYVDKYAGEFNGYKLYKIVLSTYFRNKAILGERDEYKRAIKDPGASCGVCFSQPAI
jgi:hypothetical protein